MHITCCVLCSRTSGSATIRCCIARFFEAWPTPTACLQGCPRAMAGLLHPLGLTQARLAAVRAVAQVGQVEQRMHVLLLLQCPCCWSMWLSLKASCCSELCA